MKFQLVLFIVSSYAGFAFSAPCTSSAKITGFSKVHEVTGKKSFFYKEPKKCIGWAACPSKNKSFLVKGNFVQTAQVENDFVCAIFRNFDAYNGKTTAGWFFISDLEPIRNKLERQDLIGSWNQIPCSEGDDCVIEITEDDKKVLLIEIESHLNQKPGAGLNVSTVKESSGALSLSGTEGSAVVVQPFQILYDVKDLEPGTIKLIGVKSFEGVYRK